jgi:hypothetical protein
VLQFVVVVKKRAVDFVGANEKLKMSLLIFVDYISGGKTKDLRLKKGVFVSGIKMKIGLPKVSFLRGIKKK